MIPCISLLVLGQAIVGGQGRDSAADLSGFYKPRTEITFTGIVKSKAKGSVPGYAEGISILVKSGKNLREVELGPTWFVGRQQTNINLGEKVTVTGAPLILDNRQRVVVARQIKRGKQILALRDATGTPYWDARRKTRVAMSGNRDTMYEGSVAAMKKFMINGEEYMGYTVNTANGPQDFAIAPSWYWANQPNVVNVGDAVTLYGNGPSARFGTTTLVNSFNYGGGSIVLRGPGGINPVYGGFVTPGGGIGTGGFVNGRYVGPGGR